MDNQLVLVTGGAGFIGSELVRQLVAQGFKVRAVDNLVNGKRENIEEAIGSGVEFTVTDIRDEGSMASLLQGVHLVFHLASVGVRHSIHSPIENHEVNASATLGLLKLARSVGVGRFVYISSSEVYGTARQLPIREEHPTMPMTVYGASKLAGEAYTRAFWETYRYPTVVVRPFNAYGPRCHHDGDSGGVISKFVLRCMAGQPMVVFGDGIQTRDFTFVSDIASGILAAGLSQECVGQTINLGSSKEIQIRELAGMVAHVVGNGNAEITHAEPRPGDVLRFLADSTKATNLLGFAPAVSLKVGLSSLLNWYASLGKTATQLLEEDVVEKWERRDVPSHV